MRSSRTLQTLAHACTTLSLGTRSLQNVHLSAYIVLQRTIIAIFLIRIDNNYDHCIAHSHSKTSIPQLNEHVLHTRVVLTVNTRYKINAVSLVDQPGNLG